MYSFSTILNLYQIDQRFFQAKQSLNSCNVLQKRRFLPCNLWAWIELSILDTENDTFIVTNIQLKFSIVLN